MLSIKTVNYCRVVNTSFVEVEDDSPFEFDIFMANPGVEPEQPMDVEDEEEPEDEELTSSFMINITQMAGNLECQKQFLLPPDEEVRSGSREMGRA